MIPRGRGIATLRFGFDYLASSGNAVGSHAAAGRVIRGAHGRRKGADAGADRGLRGIGDVRGSDCTGDNEGKSEDTGDELHDFGPFYVHLWL